MLEACIDTLQPAFIDPVLAPVRCELILALWRHVKPLPYPHGHAALKVASLRDRVRARDEPPPRSSRDRAGARRATRPPHHHAGKPTPAG